MFFNKADDGLDQPTNDFERSVGAVLKEKGYEVVAQVGVAGLLVIACPVAFDSEQKCTGPDRMFHREVNDPEDCVHSRRVRRK